MLQRRPHLSFGASKTFLHLQHWHWPAFIEKQGNLILLKHQALGDKFLKSMPPCQFPWWLGTGLKSATSGHVGLCKGKQHQQRGIFSASDVFLFTDNFEYVTLKPCSLHIWDISSTSVNSIKSWREAPEDENGYPPLTESRRCSVSVIKVIFVLLAAFVSGSGLVWWVYNWPTMACCSIHSAMLGQLCACRKRGKNLISSEALLTLTGSDTDFSHFLHHSGGAWVGLQLDLSILNEVNTGNAGILFVHLQRRAGDSRWSWQAVFSSWDCSSMQSFVVSSGNPH